MRTIFETCEPRADVLSGELRDEMFAARLEDVVQGSAEPVYQYPQTFFANTHPARGLKSLLAEALGRATGKDPKARPVIRLETAFGGGKTHSLIALYHLSRGARPPDVERYVDPGLLPDEPLRVVAVVGSALDPASGVEHEGLTTYTMWGEVAHQLGAYEAVHEADRQRTAPGTHTLAKVLGGGPTIVLIDELARYLEVAAGHPVGDSSLAEQTLAFLMALLEVAASAERTVVVYTLAGLRDAFAEQTEAVQRALAEARAISARTEHVITPTGEEEIAAILRHRLFEAVDEGGARETAEAYHEALSRELEKGSDLPANAGRAEYAADIRAAYPFHPELLRALNEKVSTIPNFQRTRGALRLLAQVVRRLWAVRAPDAHLIHLHHVDLSDDGIVNDLTSRLDRPQYRQVVEADIVNPLAGARAHAALADDELLAAGRPAYGTRIATAAFLHSLVQGVAAGVTPAEAKLAVYAPGDDLGLLEKQLDRLLESCWFLDLHGNRLRFSTEPSLVKVVADETQLVARTAAKQELDRRIRRIWQRGVFEPVPFPAEPSDVDDTFERPKLAVMHYDAVQTAADREEPPDLVFRIFDRAGAQQNYRRFRNNVVFLVADEGTVEHAVDQARRYLALDRLLGDPARLADFPKEQVERLRRMAGESELELRVAVTRMYRHLYYPDPAASKRHGQLARTQLPAQDQAEVDRDQSAVVLKVLRELGRLRTADDPPIPPKYVREKAWPGGDRATTLQLRQSFAERIGLQMLLDVNVLKEAVKEGIRRGVWLYFDPRRGCAWSKDSTTTPLVEISGDVELILPEAAAGVPICDVAEPRPGPEEQCPVCHRPVSHCICGIQRPQPPAAIAAQGAPAQAFQSLADQARDRGVAALGSVSLEVTGSKAELLRDLRAMALAVPQLPKARVGVDAYAALDLADGTRFSVRYEGPWERYRGFHDLIQKVKEGELGDADGRLRLTLSFDGGLPVEGPDLSTIRDVFVQLNPGAMTLRAEPVEEGS